MTPREAGVFLVERQGEDLTTLFQHPTGRFQKHGLGLCSEVTNGNGDKLPQGKFQLDRSKKDSSQWEQQSTGTGCLGTRLQNHHLQGLSKLEWTRPWEASSNFEAGSSWSGRLNRMISKDCFHPIFFLKLSRGPQVSILEISSWYGFKKK